MTAVFAGLEASALVTHNYGASQRIIEPAATWRKIKPLLAGMGITRVANVTGLDRIGIPVTTAIRPNSRSLAVAMGKGLDLMAARVSAAMESIETYHAERMSHRLRYSSYRDLQAEAPVVAVERLPQRQNSEFTEDLPILWVEARDWRNAAPVWVPYELVHTCYTTAAMIGQGCFLASTNGLASGNHPVEAFLHALYELIERDATALWRHAQADVFLRTRLNLDSINDPPCQRLVSEIKQAGLELAVWHISSDIGIPVFACVLLDSSCEHTAHAISDGMGCHSRREIALLRALTEAAQTRLGMIVSAREDIPANEYSDHRANAIRDQRMSLLLESTAAQFYLDVPTWEHPNTAAELTLLAERLAAIDCGQVLSVDLTNAAIGIPVMRVLVPGLEGPDEHPEYQPGKRVMDARC